MEEPPRHKLHVQGVFDGRVSCSVASERLGFPRDHLEPQNHRIFYGRDIMGVSDPAGQRLLDHRSSTGGDHGNGIS
jgi:hypothetical protein